MAKSAAERKAAQRERQAYSGLRKLELKLDEQELAMLERNRVARRPGRDPYELTEYVALLIRQDDARAKARLKSLSKKRCGRCGDQLPVQSCPLQKEVACWVRFGWNEVKLTP
ncbi:hypothetical protein [Erwinia persicina]|uniref:Uncharacterized protein n=1 Tax=Erwinia persicina TaxID=55211 RepID=A0A4V5UAN2_9GAMM|nr:hypothetical protein [Erwinia persicina]TKJ94787.1 hypothetical protein EpCFBP13511_00020 [Erwinia persicina]